MTTSVIAVPGKQSVVVQREYSKSSGAFVYGNAYDDAFINLLEEDSSKLVESIKLAEKTFDYSENGPPPADLLTWEYLEGVIKPYFEEIWEHAVSSYKVATGDSYYFRFRTKYNKPTSFAYSAETDIDKICSLASEYIRHFEFNKGDDESLSLPAEVLNEFSERYVYTYENIQEIVSAFKNVMLFGIVWLYLKYDHETASFTVTHLLPCSIMFSNIGRVNNNNIDWLVHEELMSRQSVLHTFCPTLLDDDIDPKTREKREKIKEEIEKVLVTTAWDGKYCTQMNANVHNNTGMHSSNNKLFCVIYKYYKYFKKKTKSYIYLKRVYINRVEIESLTEYVDYIPYIPFIISDAYEHTYTAPHRRFQSIVTRAETEIMLLSFLFSSATSRSANEIASLVMIDKKLLANQSLNMEDFQNKTVVEVVNEDQSLSIKDNIFTFDSTNPANYGIAEMSAIHDQIASKFNAIINKDSLFKSGVHYSSVANHQLKVASTTLSTIDVTMVSLHGIVKKIITQTLRRNPKAVFTKPIMDRIKKKRNDSENKTGGLFGLNISQMASYMLRVIDRLHFSPTQSSADGSKKKSDLEKIYEDNNASIGIKLPKSVLLKAMGIEGELYDAALKIDKMEEEIASLQHKLTVETILADIAETKAKAEESKAKALKLKAEVSEINAKIKSENNPSKKDSNASSSGAKKQLKNNTSKTNK